MSLRIGCVLGDETSHPAQLDTHPERLERPKTPNRARKRRKTRPTERTFALIARAIRRFRINAAVSCDAIRCHTTTGVFTNGP